MSTSTRTLPLSPAVGHVILVVHHLPDAELCDSLYLEVPIHIATTICFIGIKYLAYLGFAVLNHVGRISKSPSGASVDPSDPFESIYYFVVPNKTDAGMSRICAWPPLMFPKSYLSPSSILSVSSERTDSMRLQQSFLLRFRICIPLPIHSRLDPDDLQDIDDVRNRVLLNTHLHVQRQSLLAAVLKTPNPALRTDDVIEDSMVTSNTCTRTLPTPLQYPKNACYTFTWLVRHDSSKELYGERLDGMVGNFDEATLPSALVLHYVYGATALARWGRNSEPFMQRGRSLTLVRDKAREAYEAAD